ncbi:MAG: potassium transporter Kup [Gammaproteobacteria bacterium]
MTQSLSPAHCTHKSSLAALTLAALGVVYGDIGTSPLYAFKEAFAGEHPMDVTQMHVLATLSTMFWALMLIVSLKYVWIVLRFDNQGEGGVLALTALAHRVVGDHPKWAAFVIGIGVFASALFYGDAVITPAISVLSAIEGLSVATPSLAHMVIPITIAIILVLFFFQHRGTASVGRFFGPITIFWFLTLGVLGTISIAQTPVVLASLNPEYALDFAWREPGAAFLLLSAVFLALTGGEALYADMGHFGARPVRIAWYGLVCPALLLNYFGQGALVLRAPQSTVNPFYMLAPNWFQIPLVLLATAATVIASQATITGAYSLTLQASRLGYLPRVRILHTSDTERGQIYIPSVNWFMLLAVVVLVLQFKSSGALAAAYGIAVSGTMLITTLLMGTIAINARRGTRRWLIAGLCVFAILEVLFFTSNFTKFTHGGWMPLALGLVIFTMLTTWKRGSTLVSEQRRAIDIPMRDFLAGPQPDALRVPGTAVYLTSDPALVPAALFHNLKHYKVLHERTLFLHVVNEDIPYVSPDDRLRIREVAHGVFAADVHFGFREEPDVFATLGDFGRYGLELEPMSTSFFIARSVVVEGPGALSKWRASLFGWMTRQSESAANYFKLPPNRVVELGTQVML